MTGERVLVTQGAFTPEAFEARVLERLSLSPPVVGPDSRGDHVLNPGTPPDFSPHRRAAAVLVPVVSRPGEASVLLTRRASHLRTHSGQVAFPGGKIDPEDGTPLRAALREAQEEIGLDPALVRPLGYLDPYLTTTGFDIVPVVAVVSPGFSLVPNPEEVEAIFEVPLSFLMTPDNHERRSREWKGIERHFYAMPYGDHHIWGVTAGIVRLMYERLYGG